MTREAFIRKWLANPQKQYTEQCRDEMRDDLDLVINAALRQPPVMRSVCCNSSLISFNQKYNECFVCGKFHKKEQQTDV